MKFKQKKSTKSLSDKIADALTVKPRADIEDDHVFGTKPKTLSRADFSSSESDDDNVISDFHKRNVNLLSEISKKYEGKVVSRKDLEKEDSESSIEDSDEDDQVTPTQSPVKGKNGLQSTENSQESSGEDQSSENQDITDESDEDEDGESDDYSITNVRKQMQKSSDEEGSGDEEDDDDDNEGYDISQMEEPMQEPIEHFKKQNVSEEAKKGACVRNQLLLWEGLLEMRIHLQRCINTANQMPMPDTYTELMKNQQFADEANVTKANVSSALDKMLTLQSMLLKSFPETKNIGPDSKLQKQEKAKSTESDEEIPSDTEDEEIPSDTEEDEVAEEKKSKPKVPSSTKKRKLEDYENEISKCHKAFKTFRDSTIQKWNEKTRVATAANLKNAPTNTILQQISYILSDRNKLIRRTQLKRSEYNIVGYKHQPKDQEDKVENGDINPVTRDRREADEYIPEIFDDNDFYHQLLRELIECKSADISDPVQLSRQWIALQQMRSKMKRKVDTKATKGRKIKYVVHNQLVNYMAPEKCTSWTDEATNELYSSLFGKLFEYNNVGLNANLENGKQ